MAEVIAAQEKPFYSGNGEERQWSNDDMKKICQEGNYAYDTVSLPTTMLNRTLAYEPRGLSMKRPYNLFRPTGKAVFLPAAPFRILYLLVCHIAYHRSFSTHKFTIYEY